MISPKWVSLFRDIQDEHKSSIGLSILRFIALLASYIYRLYLYIYKIVFSLGFITFAEMRVPVISIGNLTLGGTGKTSSVEYFADYISRKLHLRVCIITRGYGAPNIDAYSDIVQVVESDGQGINKDWRDVGDEPYLLAAKLVRVPVVVSRDKIAACNYAIERLGAQVIILDDGFQSCYIKKTLEVVMISAEKPFGNKHLFPRGILREPIDGLERAQIVLILDNSGKQNIPLLREFLEQHFIFSYVSQARYKPLSISGLNVSLEADITMLRDAKVMAVCGLGSPHSFYQTLQDAGIALVKTLSYPDHYPYNEDDMQIINSAARLARAEFIITTEKDALKMPVLKGPYVPILVLHTAFEIDEPKNLYDILKKILQSPPDPHSSEQKAGLGIPQEELF
ncbi:MAG: tetraacyldisaccharide 4'-kinase [Candidatus Coatesbacteria bacterium]|nr:tetraacyldisaccharide 4'-kinase [Candidatus Coatesbacteria bacterium]